jgi:hypothetical protein
MSGSKRRRMRVARYGEERGERREERGERREERGERREERGERREERGERREERGEARRRRRGQAAHAHPTPCKPAPHAGRVQPAARTVPPDATGEAQSHTAHAVLVVEVEVKLK